MNLHVAYRAVLEARCSEVMQRRRDAADYDSLRGDNRQVGMALQADVTDLMTHQHARVRRSMRFVARSAAFQPHRRMLENERAALVAMALQAARLVAERSFHAVGAEGGVWIVAVYA